jgi:glycerophosphoryl diester phosphodiesterase
VKPTPKKVVKPELKVEVEEQTEAKVKRSENKYVKVALDAKAEERNEFVQKVKNGELKYAYYATDNDKGYHYYLVIKKQK